MSRTLAVSAAQAIVVSYKNNVRLEENFVAFPSTLATEIENDKAFFLHKGDNVSE